LAEVEVEGLLEEVTFLHHILVLAAMAEELSFLLLTP
jgi:hypothetical protein